MYYPTQEDIQALQFSEKILYTRIELLNEKYQTVYTMDYECVSSDLSTDVDSDVRNTLTMTLVVRDKRVGIAEDKLLWINKLIKVYIGVKIPYIDHILWYDKGIFVMTDYTFDAQSFTLRITCSDLVCTIDGTVGGSLEGLKNKILVADKLSIREAIINTLTDLTPYTKYNIVDMPKLIPYDLEFSTSDSVWTVLTKLRDLYPGYEMFFDVDGTFVCKQVSTLESDPVVLEDFLIQKLYTNESDNGVLSSIRNVAKIYGKCLDTDYVADSCTYDKKTNTYTASFTGVALNEDGSLPTSTKFAAKMPEVNEKESPKIIIKNRINSEESYKDVATFEMTNSLEEKIKEKFFIKDRSFVFRYRRKAMYVLGQYQIMATNILRNNKPSDEQKEKDKKRYECDDITYTIIADCPFSVEKIGERVMVCSGAEYEDIQAIDDCITRAEYEVWKAAKIIYTVTLDMVYIPWLQGNEKIRFRMDFTDEVKDWVVTSINSSYPHGTMTLNLTEFSPLYNFDIDEPTYTQLEYIESNGTQYLYLSIDPDVDTQVEMEFQLTDKDAKANYCLFGSDGQFSFRWIGESNCFRTNGNGEEYKDFSTSIAPLNKHKVVKNGLETIIDNTYKESTTSASNTNSLIALAYNDPAGVKDFAKAKLYTLKVYQADKLMRDLIPVKTEYGNICMYDKVNKMYYYNRGTGDFIAGKEVKPTEK